MDETKGCGTRLATLTMVFELAQSAECNWRSLNKSELLMDVVKGVRFEGRHQEDHRVIPSPPFTRFDKTGCSDL